MVAAAITVNGVAGSNTDLPINTVVQLNNTNNGGEITFAWTIIDQPVGTTDVLSSTTVQNPTFTPRKEGTYLIRLVVNASLGTEVQNLVVCAVRQLKTRLRVPAAGETTEADASDGWAASANLLLQMVDTLRADPGLVVLYTAGVLAVNDVVFVSGEQVIKSGLPGQETLGAVTKALASNAAHATHPLMAVVGAVAGGAPGVGSLFYARRFGRVSGLAGSPSAGDVVYLSDTGVPALSPGSNSRKIGRVMAASGGSYSFWMDGALP